MFRRFLAILIKELTQLRRDKFTFAMVLAIPVMQVFLFTYAINNDPKHLPTAVLIRDNSIVVRDLTAAMTNSEYFDLTTRISTDAEGDELLQKGEVYFVLTIPENFTRDLLSGRKPELLLQADASDPSATANSIGAMSEVILRSIRRDLTGSVRSMVNTEMPIDLRIQRCYNPEAMIRYNIVPGLIAVLLTLMGIMMTALSLTRENERGTMETMLSMPVRPLEIMAGKIVPNLIVGLIQAAFILIMAIFFFKVPFLGSWWVFVLSIILFITGNLAIGYTISSLAKNQLQALQMTILVFMPSLLLSGFIYPFVGMPGWAQAIGNCIPVTYFMRIVRGIMLKGNGLAECWPHIWPMGIIILILSIIAVKVYKKTLD